MYIALFLIVGCPLHITQGHSSLKPQNLARATTWPFPRGLFARFSKFCFNGPHQHHLCRLSLGSQWGAPTRHIGCMLQSPPTTGRPGWRSGNTYTRPLRRPPHPSGQLRCAGAPRSRECCCARSRPRPSARRLVLRAPMPQGAVAWPAATCTSATAAPERKQHVHTFMKVSDFHH